MEHDAVVVKEHDEATEMAHDEAMVREHDRAMEKVAYASGVLGGALGRPIGDDALETSDSAREAHHSTLEKPVAGALGFERGKVLGTFRDEALVK